jgi:hypothetical protein
MLDLAEQGPKEPQEPAQVEDANLEFILSLYLGYESYLCVKSYELNGCPSCIKLTF